MRLLVAILLVILVALALAGVAAVQAAPLEPALSRGLVRVDGLSALFALAVAGVALARLAAGREQRPLRTMLAAGLLAAVFQTTHLALLAAGLAGAAALADLPTRRGQIGPHPLSPSPAAQERGDAPERPWAWPIAGLVNLLLALCSGAGLAGIALAAGTWRYPVPAAGQGLNSLSFGLILAGAVGAALLGLGTGTGGQGDKGTGGQGDKGTRGGGMGTLASSSPCPRIPLSPPPPILAIGLLYPLYRLFSLGPWNLGWQLAAILLGAGVSLWGAWLAATAGDAGTTDGRLSAHLLGLAIVGAGLGSGAGLALGGFALLTLGVWQLWPADAGAHPLRWLVCGAVPLTAPFVTAWIGVAAALGAGSTLLGVALWAGALLAAVPVARGSQKAEGRRQKAEGKRQNLAGAVGPSPDSERVEQNAPGTLLTSDFTLLKSLSGTLLTADFPLLAAAFLSLALGILSPLVVGWLLEPLVAQLQGGLTPFGEVRLWPWAGLLGLDSARQPVATLPSVALGALMLILAALVWAVVRLLSLWRQPGDGQDG